MTQQIFDYYNFSEQEIKERIHNAVCQLHRLNPDQWSKLVVKMTQPSEPTEQIIAILLSDYVKELAKLWESKQVQIIEFLRFALITVEVNLENSKLKNLVSNLSVKNTLNFHYFLIFDYLRKNTDIKEKFNERINIEKIHKDLLTPPETLLARINLFRAIFQIDSLISILEHSKEEEIIVKRIENFRKSIIEYIAENSEEAVRSTELILSMEAIAKHLDILNEGLTENQFATTKDGKVFLNIFKKAARRMESKRLGIKRGGRRERKGFKWIEQNNKILFYKTVEDLPKINGTPMWDYAYKELNEKNFNYKIIDYLKTETDFKQVPNLFRDAVRTWQRYKDSFIKPNPEEKPRAFAFYHALHLLNFPKTPYTALKKYYSEGKRCCLINDLNEENSK